MHRILGIMEVSGSFVLNITKNTNYNSGYAVNINYTMRSKDNSLLLFVQTTLSESGIASNIRGEKLIVKNINNLKNFITFVDNNGGFVSDKRTEQFNRWKKMVELIDCEQHYYPEGIKQLQYQKKMGKI